ncbi:LON peptidase substrate-binding domain-containing protein [Pontibacter sp. SGAir0037]|uniref:LON peptidase substrate-binding domain-containing protein n=1 Tax=Pontibacter sp. SGAir0037 TaxID=2571030 RepID=UPI0010CD28F4|nr:LON peptidase substrate-binding domain-containing protein [Pontibacter sp. SGAir0037]QCR21676.1 peptidase [Pontibacter sp. SGAir0037]
MSRYLALFPLNIVVFPREKLNLHIFETRYKQLVHECMVQEKTFGIPTFIQENVGIYGTEVKILSIDKKYENGEMDIRTEGVGIIKILQFDKRASGRLYPGGDVEDVISADDEDIVMKQQIQELMQQLYQLLDIRKLNINLEDNFKTYDIAHHLGFNLEQEYALLQIRSEYERQALILQHLQQILPLVQETERLKERVKLNGHFKNIVPPNF